TIARPLALDHPGVHRGAVDAAADYFVGARVGERQMAGKLWLHDPLGAERKRRRRLVARLDLQRRVVDRARVEARAGAGLQAADSKAQIREMVAETHRGEIAGAARGIILQPDMDEALEERAGREDDGPRFEDLADLRLDAAHRAIRDEQALDARLPDLQIGGSLEHALAARAIGGLVCLRATSANRGSLARVEEAELDSSLVGCQSHLAAERVDLADQMALADGADRGVAEQLDAIIANKREHQGARTHPGRGERGLDTGVAGADDDDVVVHCESAIMARTRASRKAQQVAHGASRSSKLLQLEESPARLSAGGRGDPCTQC